MGGIIQMAKNTVRDGSYILGRETSTQKVQQILWVEAFVSGNTFLNSFVLFCVRGKKSEKLDVALVTHLFFVATWGGWDK